MKRFCQTEALLLSIVAMVLAFIIGCGPENIPASADIRPLVKTASDELQKQNATLAAQNTVLLQQVETLKKAVDAATAAGTFIDQAKGQGAKAKAAGMAVPDVVSNLTTQSTTLDSAKSSNAETATELRVAQEQNAVLEKSNETLAGQCLTLVGQLNTITDQATAGETEKGKLRTEVAELKKEKEDGRVSTLYHYFGWSLALLIAGIAAAIWIPAPAKTVGYVLATIGGVGLAVTLFLIVWMKVFVWVVLGAFVCGLAYIAYQLWLTHGALTKTAQGVEGIKQDLTSLVNSSPVAAVQAASGTILSDWFGSAENDFIGIFHWLHSEFSTLITRVRSLIGSKPAAAPVPNAAAAVNGVGNVIIKGA